MFDPHDDVTECVTGLAVQIIPVGSAHNSSPVSNVNSIVGEYVGTESTTYWSTESMTYWSRDLLGNPSV